MSGGLVGLRDPAAKILQSVAEAVKITKSLKAEGKRVIFANGAFDLLHVGHLRALKDARNRGDVLLVATNSDISIQSYKGKNRPIVPENERVEMLCSLECVDYVLKFDEPDVHGLLEQILPSAMAKGRDFTVETVPEAPTCKKCGIDLEIVGDPKEHSTTDILQKIKALDSTEKFEK